MAKFLISGLGSIGRRHLRNLAALGEKDIVLLRSHKATLGDEELEGFPVESDLLRALEAHRPDAVIVSNPTALHLDVAIPAAERGCAILLEKPVSDSLQGVDRLQEAARRSGAKILMGLQFRYHPSLRRVARLISEGEIGRIISAHVHYGEYLPAWHPWEDYRQGYAARSDLGGGVLLTQCHALDYLPWLVGRVESIWGYVGKLSDLEVDVEDTAEIGLRFTDGPLGTVHLDYAQQPPSHTVSMTGTRGTIECDLLGGAVRLFRAERGAWHEFPMPEGWERNSMFLDEMRHFLGVVKGDVQPACPLGDGVRVMEMIDAVRASDSFGRLINLQQ
jgi:predicted dehydrogenase